jgi:hypothetical protein
MLSGLAPEQQIMPALFLLLSPFSLTLLPPPLSLSLFLSSHSSGPSAVSPVLDKYKLADGFTTHHRALEADLIDDAEYRHAFRCLMGFPCTSSSIFALTLVLVGSAARRHGMLKVIRSRHCSNSRTSHLLVADRQSLFVAMR